jgi:hypothetical protein
MLSPTELAKLPYVQRVPKDGRVVPLLTFFDGADWYLWIPVKDDELGRMAGGEVISGSYCAASTADPTRDFEFPLGTLINMRASFGPAMSEFAKLESDIHRCAAVLEKYHMFFREPGGHRNDMSLLVVSELEYLLVLLRSLYDVLQCVVAAISGLLRYSDGSRVSRSLTLSFASVALRGDDIRTSDQIHSEFGIPLPLAHWYEQQAPFFRALRGLRDDIAHRGGDPSTVFCLPRGFAVAPTQAPWSRFDFWPEAERSPEGLGSLRKFFASFILSAIDACNEFGRVLAASVVLPPAISDDVRFIIRSPFGRHLVNLPAMRAQPWEGLS